MRDEDKSREQLLADLHSLRHRVGELEKERETLPGREDSPGGSELFHRLALEAAQMGTWDWDLVSGKHTWSKVHEQIWGYEPGTFPGTTEAFKERIHPDDLPGLLSSGKDARKTGDSFQTEFRVIRPDGSMRWVTITGRFLFDIQSRPIRLVGVASDITERKMSEQALSESEEQFKAIFETASIGMAQADPRNGKWVRVNRKMCEITGYSPEEMLCLRVPQITHPEDRQADWEAFQNVVTGKTPDHRIEKRYIRKDGEIVWVNVNMTVIRDPSGQPVRTMATIEDITSRKLAEESLRVQEERLRAAMDVTRQGWSDLNVQTGEVTVSPQYARMLGYDPADFTSDVQSWIDSIHPEDRTAVREAFQQCLETGETRATEYRRRTKTGEWKWIRSIGKIISFDSAGSPLRMIGTHADISDIRQAEAARRQSEELYRTLVETSPDSITLMDTYGVLMFTSRKTLQLFGYSPEEDLTGRSVFDWVAPEEHERASQDFRFLLSGGTLTGKEYILLRKAGSPFWGEVNAAVFFSPEGKPRGMLTITRDVTESKRAMEALKESEAKFRSYIESAPVGIFVADEKGLLIDFNPAVLEIIGYDRDMAQGMHILDLHPSEDRDEVLKEFSILMETGHVETERRIKRANGDVIWVSMDVTRLANRYSLGYCQDITERRRAEDAQRDSLEEKVALLKEVHHRVKNNLQIVASLLDLQANRTANEQVVDVLQDTRNRVKSMALLHETLYRSGNLARINFASYLKDLCGQLLHSFSLVAGRITMEYDVSETALPLEQAVPCGLIVGELVSNALKHGFPDERMGRIIVGLKPAAGATLVLSVRDDGIGLSPGLNPMSTSTLGLKLVYGLTDQLNGQCEMKLGDPGASFHIKFPAPVIPASKEDQIE